MTKAAIAKSFTMYTWPDGSKRSKAAGSFSLGWTEVTPAVVSTDDLQTRLGQGIYIDPNDASTWYWCNGPLSGSGRLFKSVDSGSSWTAIGNCTPSYLGATTYIENPLHVWVDPANSLRVICCAGVRGTNTGFWISTDGGVNFTCPAGIKTAADAASISGTNDVYDFAVNPANSNHFLISFHSPFGGAYSTNSGIMGSTDGGATWTVYPPSGSWGTGHAVNYLYHSASGTGDANTWLVGAQFGAGMWRTTNAGSSWTQVTTVNIAHGGCQIAYTAAGVLYAGGEPNGIKSTDNGANWTTSYGTASWSVFTNGTNLFTGPNDVAADSLQYSAVASGTSWADVDATSFTNGPFCGRVDAARNILVVSFWYDGVWVYRYA